MSMAIAGHFNLDLFQLTLSDPHLDDAKLADLLTRLPERCVLLLEDIDSAGLTREVAKSSKAKAQEPQQPAHQGPRGVTLAGVLNAIDGAVAPEGHILIMSSNAPEALDPALIRGGRVDYKVELSNANRVMAANIFKRMMTGTGAGEDELNIQAAKFASCIPEGVLAPASIQGYLLERKGNLDAAVTGIEKWVAKFLQSKDTKDSASEKSATSRKRKRSGIVSDSDRVLRKRNTN